MSNPNTSSSSSAGGGSGGESSSGAEESIRYQYLTRTLDKALTESRKKINARAAVKECYGEDASIIGEETLAELVENVVDEANVRIRAEIAEVLSSGDVKAKLALLDNLLAEHDARDKAEQLAEESDRNSARAAADAATLPPEVRPEDVLTYHAYQIKVQERDALLAELASVEEENEALKRQIDRGTALIKETVKEVEEKGKAMERTADVGTFSGVS